MTIRVRIDNTSEAITDDAKKVIEHQQKRRFEKHSAPAPMGVAFHAAVYPLRCDECGKTYWARDEYGSHIACEGYRKGPRGGFA